MFADWPIYTIASTLHNNFLSSFSSSNRSEYSEASNLFKIMKGSSDSPILSFFMEGS